MDNWKITFGGQPVTLVGTHLLPGDRAPRFEVLDGNLQPVASTQFKDKTMIISVFPSVDTSVCALQNIRFNREASRLDKDVVILSLSICRSLKNASARPSTSTTSASTRTTATWISA